MTAEERVLAAIKLKRYDRIPVAPHINAEYPLVHKGKTSADAYDPAKWEEGFKATTDLWKEVGGWDGATLAGHAVPYSSDSMALYRGRGGLVAAYNYPGRSKAISVNSPPQYAEAPLISFEEYDRIIKLGWRGFLKKTAEEKGLLQSAEQMAATAKAMTDRYLLFVTEWKKRGVPVMAGWLLEDPQMNLCLARTLSQFTLDMYRHPDKVQAVLDAMVDDMLEDALENMKAAGPVPPGGLPGIMMACERGSGQYMNLKLFERFVWPYMKKMINAWTKAGYIVTIHLDTNWTLNLPYFKELDKKMCILELDSTTNIFKAKEILKDHMCIMGDVPPSISSHGTTADMESYCNKLVDIVGKDTGFILSNGCAVPPDTKDENFKAMINSVNKHAPGNGKNE